jgi:hypothetical protein
MESEIAEKVLSDLERIFDPKTSEVDVLETLSVIRETVRQVFTTGVEPKTLIKKIVIYGTDLGKEIEKLSSENEALKKNIPDKSNGHYTMEDFLVALARKRGKTYGWLTTYVNATVNTPGARSVRSEDIAQWRKKDQVPEWAYNKRRECS